MRPPFKPTDQQRADVARLAGLGFPQEDIARLIGITSPTLRKHFAEELETGRLHAVAEVAKTLYAKAMEGNVPCMIFFLKARGGWRDRPEEGGKREAEQKAALTAERGSEWEDLLQ